MGQMNENLPAPLVPADVDLRDFPYTPLVRARLFGSSFHARATDAEWRAGVTLWLKSWDQVPAGTLPDDDIDLCRLAEFGRDLKVWKKVKRGALHGWVKCSDGRMHHSVVAEGVLAAWDRRASSKKKGMAGASKRWADKNTPGNDFGIAGAMPGDSKGEGKGEGREKEPAFAIAQAGGEAPPPLSKPSNNANALPEEPPIDDVTRLWHDGLKIVRALTKMANGPARKLLGSWVDVISADHVAMLEILKAAEIKQPDDPIAWIRASIDRRLGDLLARAPNDPYGLRAWLARQPDANVPAPGDPICIADFDVAMCAESVAGAIGIAESWRGNWDALGAWLRDDLDVMTPPVLHALSDQAARMNGNFRSMAAFDGAVRAVAKRVMPA